jgi:hypothetical protein
MACGQNLPEQGVTPDLLDSSVKLDTAHSVIIEMQSCGTQGQMSHRAVEVYVDKGRRNEREPAFFEFPHKTRSPWKSGASAPRQASQKWPKRGFIKKLTNREGRDFNRVLAGKETLALAAEECRAGRTPRMRSTMDHSVKWHVWLDLAESISNFK